MIWGTQWTKKKEAVSPPQSRAFYLYIVVPVLKVLRDELSSAQEGFFNVGAGLGRSFNKEETIFFRKLSGLFIANVNL